MWMWGGDGGRKVEANAGVANWPFMVEDKLELRQPSAKFDLTVQEGTDNRLKLPNVPIVNTQSAQG